jgi:GTP-binding protein Era
MKAGFVSFVGRPNAGKSTLLNRLVGTKLAIVSDKPQTTRNRILGVKNYEHAQVVFVDTPGIHRPLHRMNVRMVDTAVEAISDVDVAALVVDASEKPGHGRQFVLDLLAGRATRAVLVLNKVDLVAKPKLLPIMQQFADTGHFQEIVPVSALTGENVDRLERVFLDLLPEGEPLYPPDYLTDQPERFFIAEIIREAVLQHTHAELPFASAVVIDRVEEPGEGRDLLTVYASILVERDSQKPIVIGRGGDMIKRIGTDARKQLEAFFATRAYLDLRVRVKAEWREDDRTLDDLGVRGR